MAKNYFHEAGVVFILKKANMAKKRIVTRSDAKKLRPLTHYWNGRLKVARDSDNWPIALLFTVLGFILGLIA